MTKMCAALLLPVLLLAACAPSASPTPPAAGSTPSASSAQAPIPLATSRGDKLQASPPDSVRTGAGKPVLVEFFRFT